MATHDLTTVLTTIAAASASIVAILGGFIASKLIAISSERSAALERLKQIDEELAFHVSERDKFQAENNEDDALGFIRDAIDDLYNGISLETVYSNIDHPRVSMETLKPYWDRSVTLKEQFLEKLNQRDTLTEDYIPESLLLDVKEDDFGYEVLRALGRKQKERIRASERASARSNSPFGLTIPDINDLVMTGVMEDVSVPVKGYSYQKNCESIQEHKSVIALLNLQKKQCEEQISTLKKPRGMGLGLLIFALFTIFCIIIPLGCSPFSTDSYKDFIIAKGVFLGLFVIGLITIFGYLVYLLKWNQDS